MKLADARRIALSLPEVTEEPHFEMSSFRVRGKIFATVPAKDVVRVFVDEELRDLMVGVDPKAYEKVWWGKKVVGLRVLLSAVKAKDLELLFRAAWEKRAPKRLLGKVSATPRRGGAARSRRESPGARPR
jgi:hypothetical protein